MSVLVTGATGLVGTHLIPLLDSPVTALYKTAPGPGKARWIQHDLTGLAPDIPDGTEALVHLAQARSFRAFPGSADEVFAVNVQSTQVLLDAAHRKGVRTFILASTGGVYRPQAEPLTEQSPLLELPASYYAATKRAAELLCLAYRDQMNIVLLRFFFIYGSVQDPNMLMPRLVRRIRNGETVRFPGNGMRFNPIHAQDAAAAIVAALALRGQNVINVAGPEITDLRSVSLQIGELIGKDPEIRSEGGTTDDYVADITLMERSLLRPVVDIAGGLEELCSSGSSTGEDH